MEDALRAGRDAFNRRAWPEAFELLSIADKSGRLLGEDLDALAWAAVWIGKFPDALAARQRAHAAHLRAGDRRRAALSAVMLAGHYACRLNLSVAAGWLGKAGRLLEGEEEGIEHGYLSLAIGWLLLESGKLDGVIEHARKMVGIGERFGDLDLQALGLNFEGYALLKKGSVAEALPLIDEAMAPAAADELGPLASIYIYCHTISSCLDLFDFRRASEWAEVARHCPAQSGAMEWVSGDCHVHEARLMKIRGAWEEGELEAEKGCAIMTNRQLDHVGMAWYEIGEFRRLRGELESAEEAYRQARELGHTIQPGLALLRLAQGNIVAARGLIKSALADESLDRLARASVLPAGIEVAIAARDIEWANMQTAELSDIADHYGTQALHASSSSARGAVALARGDPQCAIKELWRAVRLWREVDAPYEIARSRILLSSALRAIGDSSGAALELEVAKSGFERLGAACDLNRANQLTEALQSQASRSASTVPGPSSLTRRELEVARLAAEGLTSPQIAERLFITDRTVEWHLSNAYAKLGIESRRKLQEELANLGL